jgi:hypothetical protein
MLPIARSPLACARLAGALAISLMVAGCVTAAGKGDPATPGATPTTPPTPSVVPSQPSGPSSAAGFYLRATRTQALAPQYTFNWLAVATISDGKFIDGMIAIPMIYPGPLWVGPVASTISPKGIDTIVAEARKLGLLGDKTDFSDRAMAGAVTGHINLVIDGKTYDLTGPSDTVLQAGAVPAPGSAAAFTTFWNEVTSIGTWLKAELGQSASYAPDRLAVLALPPTTETSGITPNEVPWPLATNFAGFGTAMGNDTFRCAVVSGADLAKLLPVVKQSNALTRFRDAAGVKDSLLVRVLVPGEPSPCA